MISPRWYDPLIPDAIRARYSPTYAPVFARCRSSSATITSSAVAFGFFSRPSRAISDALRRSRKRRRIACSSRSRRNPTIAWRSSRRIAAVTIGCVCSTQNSSTKFSASKILRSIHARGLM